MSTESQIKANRRSAQKSTGPKTAEGKAVVAQNALKHGLFARENVIKCEKQEEFDRFREELLAGLAPVEGVEAMLAERIISLSWRLKRVERMNSEAVDVTIAKIETDSLERSWRRKAGLLDPEDDRSKLVLGWATIKDFSGSNAVLERLLLYEKRIESSLYKAMNELQKLQRIRKTEQTEASEAEPANSPLGEAATHPATTPALPKACGFEAATRLENQTGECEKQSQIGQAGTKWQFMPQVKHTCT